MNSVIFPLQKINIYLIGNGDSMFFNFLLLLHGDLKPILLLYPSPQLVVDLFAIAGVEEIFSAIHRLLSCNPWNLFSKVFSTRNQLKVPRKNVFRRNFELENKNKKLFT